MVYWEWWFIIVGDSWPPLPADMVLDQAYHFSTRLIGIMIANRVPTDNWTWNSKEIPMALRKLSWKAWDTHHTNCWMLWSKPVLISRVLRYSLSKSWARNGQLLIDLFGQSDSSVLWQLSGTIRLRRSWDVIVVRPLVEAQMENACITHRLGRLTPPCGSYKNLHPGVLGVGFALLKAKNRLWQRMYLTQRLSFEQTRPSPASWPYKAAKGLLMQPWMLG